VQTTVAAAAPPADAPTETPKQQPTTESMEETKDVEMEDAPSTEIADDLTANLDEEALKNLTETMGFSLLRAQKGLLFGTGGTVEGAIEWLVEHQDDDDIDDPIAESTHKVKKPMTAEEKAAKILEIKALLKTKRTEREEAEKVDHTEREKARRLMGKEMAKTREQMEMEQRKRDAQKRKQEKIAFKLERQRIKAELEKDKRERMANNGKLSSKLGVDGYNPDGIQYDVDAEGADAAGGEDTPKKKTAANASKIDEYIKKVSSYRAGGDGGKCLKVLKAYVGNLADNPEETKFRSINTENKAYKTKVKPFIGAKNLLLSVGFKQEEGGTSLIMNEEDLNKELLSETKAKLEAALAAY